MNKCTKDNWCKAMGVRIKGSADSGGGIYTVEILNMEKGVNEVIGACYKTRRGDKGVIFNYCPWCGEKIFDAENFCK